MCGILGHVSDHPGALELWSAEAAVASLRHRGPDGHGTWENRDERAACRLVHTRLAIIDLSEGGRQPMLSADGRFVLVFNGEIYNYRELRDEMSARGEVFSTESDTEVLLRAFGRWGEECLPRLRGMFAFGVWDRRERTLTLARDRLGIKPLYLSHPPGDSGGLAFASEVRALLSTGLAPRKISPQGIEAFLGFGAVWGRQTIVEGVIALPPASVVTWRAGRLTERTWWRLPAPCVRSRQTEATEPIRPLLEEAVGLQLRSDVQLGIFLSAGLDSASLAALARRKVARPPVTLTVTFDDPRSEGVEAARVARFLGTEHREVHVSLDEAASSVTSAVLAMDQPSIDGVNTWFVSRAAHDAGLKVALSGLGGDEVFAGYATFRRFGALLALGRWSRAAGRMTVGVARRAPFALFPGRWRKALWLADAGGEPVRSYAVLRSLFTADQAAALWPGHGGLARFVQAPVGGDGPVNTLSRLELTHYLRDTLLRDTDVMSMAHGLEVRPPLLDDVLVERLLSLPGKLKIAGIDSKPLLAAAVRDLLPADVLRRKKTGFELPFDRWLRGPLSGWLAEGFRAAREIGLRHEGLEALVAAHRRGESSVQSHRFLAPAVLGHWAQAQKMSR